MSRAMTTIGAASVAALAIALGAAALNAQDRPGIQGSDPPHKVRLDFNRWHDSQELYDDLRALEKAYPKFLKLQSIGKSVEGRDLMVMTINNPATGPEASKAAMYIEANVHGNEIQGGEVAVYTVWYLMENYGRIPDITKLVDERVFYIVPTVNPDGRDYFLHGTGAASRSGAKPVDDDNDGLFDEDPPEDINGNNNIEQIRKYVPGEGNLRLNADDPRILEPVPAGQKGDWILLGQEGIDNDGDGRVNEDGPGSYDGNRNWGSDWQPNYIQSGAMDYPFQLPESRAINDFLMAHPSIAGTQTYHNNGGMILRGPGAEWSGEYPAADVRVYDQIGQQGERMLPYYDYIVIWSGLYTVHGGFTDWTNDGLGIISFSNELWNGNQYFNSPKLQTQQKDVTSPIAGNRADYWFDDHLEFGDEFVDWTDFEHPQFGKVQLGGWKKTQGRVPPRFMQEELAHRNMAFTLFQAAEMPLMRLGESKVERVGGDVWKVRLDIRNDRIAPTILARAAQHHVVPPDLLTADGNVEVVAAGWVANKFRPGQSDMIDQKDLRRIMVRNGHPGNTTRTIEYVVKGSGPLTVKYASAKGGTVEKRIALQ
ncbi:MAG: peptidase M14 [Gemmatimonadetes bacterium]|nr:peptidase M14 [Gemmatimonadota bacterium]